VLWDRLTVEQKEFLLRVFIVKQIVVSVMFVSTFTSPILSSW